MGFITSALQGLAGEVEIPRSIPGLVTEKLLVMSFLDGVKITSLKDRVKSLPQRVQRQARARILDRVARAYGHMILDSGLFQADPHPGNILIMKGMSFSLSWVAFRLACRGQEVWLSSKTS